MHRFAVTGERTATFTRLVFGFLGNAMNAFAKQKKNIAICMQVHNFKAGFMVVKGITFAAVYLRGTSANRSVQTQRQARHASLR